MKKTSIKFEMSPEDELQEDLLEVNHGFYTKKITCSNYGIKFPVPVEIVVDLDLKSGDTCYFCKYSEGFYISFKHKPQGSADKNIKSRKLCKAGDYDTLYVRIPAGIAHSLHPNPTSVSLVQVKGFQNYEWQINFLFTD